ncbi:MAG: hypothetical protein GXP35_16445 [Actinobacteria bacterium]|nr:hypothetical protein [Actinomycetota bacterium]
MSPRLSGILIGRMAKSSSVSKVARAAAQGSRPAARPGERNVFFPLAMALVVLIGVGFVFLARGERVSSADNSEPLVGDHWHSAYDVNICGVVQPALPNDAQNRTGIHSHGDGLIHIHPFLTTVTGRAATLGVFFEEGGYTLTDTTLQTPTVDVSEDATLCNGNPSELVVLKWVNVTAPDPLVFREGLAEVRLDNDDPARGQLFTIALIELDGDVDFADMKPEREFLDNYINSDLDLLPLTETDETPTGTDTPVDDTPVDDAP